MYIIGVPEKERKDRKLLKNNGRYICFKCWKQMHKSGHSTNFTQMRKLRPRVVKQNFQGFFITNYESNANLLIQELKISTCLLYFLLSFWNEFLLHNKSENIIYRETKYISGPVQDIKYLLYSLL
jgi:hypothetical protein